MQKTVSLIYARCDTNFEAKSPAEKILLAKNCQNTLEEFISGSIILASSYKPEFVYVYLVDESDAPEQVSGIKVFTRKHVEARLDSLIEVKQLRAEIIEAIEFELCAHTAFFVGNKFSTYSDQIIMARENLPSKIMGEK
jgi:hypothetical protein